MPGPMMSAFLFISLVIGWLFISLVMIGYGDLRCKEMGFRTASITWNFEIWCVKREDQTDVVRRLRELEKR
jgi:hypothetical protein